MLHLFLALAHIFGHQIIAIAIIALFASGSLRLLIPLKATKFDSCLILRVALPLGTSIGT